VSSRSLPAIAKLGMGKNKSRGKAPKWTLTIGFRSDRWGKNNRFGNFETTVLQHTTMHSMCGLINDEPHVLRALFAIHFVTISGVRGFFFVEGYTAATRRATVTG
jgi:hypothetical protein